MDRVLVGHPWKKFDPLKGNKFRKCRSVSPEKCGKVRNKSKKAKRQIILKFNEMFLSVKWSTTITSGPAILLETCSICSQCLCIFFPSFTLSVSFDFPSYSSQPFLPTCCFIEEFSTKESIWSHCYFDLRMDGGRVGRDERFKAACVPNYTAEMAG